MTWKNSISDSSKKTITPRICLGSLEHLHLICLGSLEDLHLTPFADLSGAAGHSSKPGARPPMGSTRATRDKIGHNNETNFLWVTNKPFSSHHSCSCLWKKNLNLALEKRTFRQLIFGASIVILTHGHWMHRRPAVKKCLFRRLPVFSTGSKVESEPDPNALLDLRQQQPPRPSRAHRGSVGGAPRRRRWRRWRRVPSEGQPAPQPDGGGASASVRVRVVSGQGRRQSQDPRRHRDHHGDRIRHLQRDG